MLFCNSGKGSVYCWVGNTHDSPPLVSARLGWLAATNYVWLGRFVRKSLNVPTQLQCYYLVLPYSTRSIINSWGVYNQNLLSPFFICLFFSGGTEKNPLILAICDIWILKVIMRRTWLGLTQKIWPVDRTSFDLMKPQKKPHLFWTWQVLCFGTLIEPEVQRPKFT